MTKSVQAKRVPKSLFLVALLLAQVLLVVPPTAQASPTTCRAVIDRIQVTPHFALPGDSVTVRVFLRDANTLPDNPGETRARVNIKAQWSNGAQILSDAGQSPTDQVTGRFEAFLTVPADITGINGEADIQAVVRTNPSALEAPGDFNTWCLANPDGNTNCCGDYVQKWNFYVGERPDLTVVPGTLKMYQHFDGDETPFNSNHATELDPVNRFVRYPTVTGFGANACVEETATQVSRVHFSFEVRNDGETDFKGSDSGAPLPLTFRVKDNTTILAQGQTNLTSIPRGQTAKFDLIGLNYTLVNRPGLRNITIEVDSNNLYKETDEANNVFLSPQDKNATGAVYIKAPDVVPGLFDVVHRASDGKVEGKFNMSNIGDFAGGAPAQPGGVCRSRTAQAPFVRVYLDKVQPGNELANISQTLDAMGSGTWFTDNVGFTSKDKVGAGLHRVIAKADAPVNETILDALAELEENNNVLEFAFTVEDKKVPVLSQIAFPAEGRTGQAINISGNVTDDANFTLEGNNVFLDFTYPDGSNQTFVIPKANTNQSGFIQNNPTNEEDVRFWLNGTYNQEGVHSFVIRATDTVNNVTSGPHSFRLVDYPKNMELVSLHVCRDSALNNTIDQSSCRAYNTTSPHPANLTFLNESLGYNQVARIRFKVPPGATGIQLEDRNASRKSVEIRDRDGEVLGNFTPTAVCFNNLTLQLGGDPYQEGSACSNAGGDCINNLTCWVNTFQVIIGHGRLVDHLLTSPVGDVCQGVTQQRSTNLTKPAQWNVTFWVGDAACKFRGHTPDQQPKAVTFRFGLWDTVPATVTNTTIVGGSPVAALSPVRFRTDAEDNLTVLRTFVRVLKNGQEVLLDNLTKTANVDANGKGTYDRGFPTGIYTNLDQDGEYQWGVAAVDANLTISWNNANGQTCVPDNGCTVTFRTFRLNDGRQPSAENHGTHLVTAAGVDAAPKDSFQLGETFALQVDADDDTRITVTGEVQNSAGTRLFERTLQRVAGTLYRSDNITTGAGGNLTEGDYRFVIRVRDSANKVQETAFRAFRVASNLAPSFSQRSPADDGFGPTNGTVGVDVSDTLQGIVTNSVAALFGVNTDTPTTPASNLVVTKREERSDGVPTVVRASFQLPSTVRHGDRVVVLVSATDGSTPTPLAGNTTWNFTIDGLAPVSTLTCTRAHPATCGAEGPQAVRGDTEFTLAATDPDPQNRARSGVAGLRFAVDIAGSPGTLQAISGTNTTFRLGTFAASDGFYTVRFRAVDAAGNEEPERRLTFALDTQGPSIQNVLATPTPQGWNLTATISDTHADVRSARLHYRAGAQPFEEVPLSRLPETTFWFGNLPGARRGQQVCYYVEATDFLDNLATSGSAASPVCFNSENHPPSLTVTAPREGDDVAGSLTVRWQASDIDADPFTVTLGYRRSGDVTFVPIPVSTEEQGQRTKIVDTGALAAGAYQLRVQAADNQPFNNLTQVVVNFTLGGGSSDLSRPQLDRVTVAPGEPVKVRVVIPRPAVNVEARLLRGTEVVQTQEMEQNPPGSTTWEAEFRVTDPGVYQVEVRGEYEDGEPFVLRAASALTVAGGGLPVDLVLLGVLAVVVVAMAAMGLRRRGWL